MWNGRVFSKGGSGVGKEYPGHHVLAGVHCPTCRGPYELVKFVGRRGDLYKVVVHCHTCNSYGVGTARISETESGFVPPSPITSQNVEQMRDFLEQFDGDFQRLFGSDSSS
jgi:hypothetical protein